MRRAAVLVGITALQFGLAVAAGCDSPTAAPPDDADAANDAGESGDGDAAMDAGSDAPLVCDHPDATAPTTDLAYRVVIGATVSGAIPFPAPTESWQLEYRFTTPPLPCSTTWNHNAQVFYDWGDVDFDTYGAKGTTPLSKYQFNQIVPQVMTGFVLSGNDARYVPSGTMIDHWVIQAQYFWEDQDGTPYDQTGPIVAVQPGDALTTLIAYDSTSGAITASIAGVAGTSSITIPRPFPNESTPPFASWRDFFTSAVSQSGSPLVGRPLVNVESHYADEAKVCATLPFEVTKIALPGISPTGASYQVTTRGGLTCPGIGLSDLKF